MTLSFVCEKIVNKGQKQRGTSMIWRVVFAILVVTPLYCSAEQALPPDLKKLVHQEVLRILPGLLKQYGYPPKPKTGTIYEDFVHKTLMDDLAAGRTNVLVSPPMPLPTVGRAQAPKVVLIFTDPYCLFCHQSLEIYESYIQKHPDVKMIIHDFPLGGRDSYVAARALLAAHQHKKHKGLRKALHQHTQKNKKTLPENEILLLAESQGLNKDHIQKKMRNDTTQKILRHTFRIAKYYNIKATPSFILITDPNTKPRVEEGMVSPEELFDGT